MPSLHVSLFFNFMTQIKARHCVMYFFRLYCLQN